MSGVYTRRSLGDVALIVAFLAALVAPSAFMLGSRREAALAVMGEQVVPCPSFEPTASSLTRLPSGIQTYFNANFGLRPELIHGASLVKLHLLHSPANQRVILGTDDWLYYAGENEEDCTRRLKPFSSAELSMWKRVLEGRRDWLVERGIPYLFVIAPDKHSIQSEHLPEWIRLRPGASRLDQLISYMHDYSTVEVVDLRQSLRDAMREQAVYLRTDTHWNAMGTFVAYREIASALRRRFPALEPVTLADFDERPAGEFSGDLSRMLGLSGHLTEHCIRFEPKRPRSAQYVSGPDGQVTQGGRAYERPAASGRGAEIPRAVVFHDSFAEELRPYLSEHFGRVVYQWRSWGFDTELVERERPAVVISEMAERLLMRDVAELSDLSELSR